MVVAFFLALVPVFLPAYAVNLLTSVLIFGLLAMSLDLLLGYTGLVSLGHAAFFGVAGYTAGILAVRNGISFWLAAPIGVIAAGAVAMVFGLIALRTSGAYFLMVTMALGQMLYAAAWRWRSLTGGDDGLPGIPRPDLGWGLSFWDNTYFYYFVLAFFTISAYLLFRLVKSPFGSVLVGIRENETRMQSLGYNTWLYKYLAYVVAGVFAGVAGVLYAYYNGFVSPGHLSWTLSGAVMLMVIIGGAGTLWGPAVGAAVVVLLEDLVSSYTERWPMVMGAIFIVCVLYARQGIAGYLNAFIAAVQKQSETKNLLSQEERRHGGLTHRGSK